MHKYFEQRLSGIRTKMNKAGIDAFYINHEENVGYFTAKKGNDCALYITEKEAFIITDFRYRTMASELDALEYVETTNSYRTIDFLKSRNEKVIGVEKDFLPLADYLEFTEVLSNKTIKPVSGLVENLRIYKTEEEIQDIAKAEEISDKSFMELLDFIKPGITEKRIAAELEYLMRCNGSDGVSFDTIAVAGANGALPHGVPGEKCVEVGEFLTLDFGAMYNGYHADMTRTVAIGGATQEMIDVYNIVLEAQLNCCNKLHAGISGVEGDAYARDIIVKAGYGDYFGHGTGHGVGLEIHESPRTSPAYPGMLEENMTITIEPGIYLPGKFGVRIEDLAIVKPNGIINLTSSPKELIIL